MSRASLRARFFLLPAAAFDKLVNKVTTILMQLIFETKGDEIRWC